MADKPTLVRPRPASAKKLQPVIEKPEDIKTLTDLRAYFKITSWDAILVTDGSATTFDNPGGGAGVLFKRTEVQPQLCASAVSHVTNNAAELMAVFWPLFVLAERGLGAKNSGYVVHVISDSTYVVEGITNLMSSEGTSWAMEYGSNRSLWLAMLGLKRKGIVMHAHYVPRDTIQPNKICHNVANHVRKQMKTAMAELYAQENVENALIT